MKINKELSEAREALSFLKECLNDDDNVLSCQLSRKTDKIIILVWLENEPQNKDKLIKSAYGVHVYYQIVGCIDKEAYYRCLVK